MKQTAIRLAREAGALLLQHLGKVGPAASKGDHANVVTEADIASERLIVDGIRRRFPDHSIIAEETGCDLRASPFTWVVDPLDGTSNFAARIPWFGVLIALLKEGEPVIGVCHLPVADELYVAEKGAGAQCNGRPIAISPQTQLRHVLWAYGMDGSDDSARNEREVRLLGAILARVRNVRATNSLVDAAWTADGRLGGMLNQSTRLWDIAAPSLLVREAGGRYTQLSGQDLAFDLSATAADKVYAVLAGAPELHRQMIEVIAGAG